ncbi:MAG: polysaccharide deacetylase [Bradyrhizobiaceae bacterium]|nr:MAG: polysaccharide deacetylase [Bradyrhizobiaceae bacterium]
MKRLRSTIIQTGLDTMSLTGAHRLLRPIVGGIGLILMLHRVRPAVNANFQPNRHLEITPDFLRLALEHLRAQDIDIVTMDEVCRRLNTRDFSRRFACFTFDDGYRDNRDHALPVMQDFDAPLTVYVASDFARGSGRLWWVTLERIVANVSAIEAKIGGEPIRLDASTIEDKQNAFAQIHDRLRSLPTDHDVRDEVAALARHHGIDDTLIANELCMTWDELRSFAARPLVTIGAHTVTHCNLAHESPEMARQEMQLSRQRIETALGDKVRHFAYPYGDKSAAGSREFAIAKSLGFETAVTTRPGVLFPEHTGHLTALPRISLNGNYQSERFLPVLMSGAATAIWNGFRRIDAA